VEESRNTDTKHSSRSPFLRRVRGGIINESLWNEDIKDYCFFNHIPNSSLILSKAEHKYVYVCDITLFNMCLYREKQDDV